MQLFSADATIFFKKIEIFFASENMNNRPQKLLINGPYHFFQYWPGCSNGPKAPNASLGI